MRRLRDSRNQLNLIVTLASSVEHIFSWIRADRAPGFLAWQDTSYPCSVLVEPRVLGLTRYILSLVRIHLILGPCWSSSRSSAGGILILLTLCRSSPMVLGPMGYISRFHVGWPLESPTRWDTYSPGSIPVEPLNPRPSGIHLLSASYQSSNPGPRPSGIHLLLAPCQSSLKGLDPKRYSFSRLSLRVPGLKGY